MIFTVATFAILLTISLGLARALMGPTVYDRILAVNMVGTKTVLLIAVFAVLSGRTDMLDIALTYALINLVGVVAVLKFVEQGNFYWNSGIFVWRADTFMNEMRKHMRDWYDGLLDIASKIQTSQFEDVCKKVYSSLEGQSVDVGIRE